MIDHDEPLDDSREIPDSEETYDPDASTCHGHPLRFDPTKRGETCGGLALVGWMICVVCGRGYLPDKSLVTLDDGAGNAWKLARGGRSLTAGAIKLRAEGKQDVSGLKEVLERIVRVPDMERRIIALEVALHEACVALEIEGIDSTAERLRAIAEHQP